MIKTKVWRTLGLEFSTDILEEMFKYILNNINKVNHLLLKRMRGIHICTNLTISNQRQRSNTEITCRKFVRGMIHRRKSNSYKRLIRFFSRNSLRLRMKLTNCLCICRLRRKLIIWRTIYNRIVKTKVRQIKKRQTHYSTHTTSFKVLIRCQVSLREQKNALGV